MASNGSHCRRAAERGQALLISLVVVMLIIAVLAGIMYPKMAGRSEYAPNGQVKGTATPIDRAYDAGCTIYMQQVSAAAIQYRQDHNAPPRDLESLKPYGLTEEIINAPNCNYGLPKRYAPANSAPGAPAPTPPGSVTVAPGINVPTGGGAAAAGVNPSDGGGN